jgi:hypothetical protein
MVEEFMGGFRETLRDPVSEACGNASDGTAAEVTATSSKGSSVRGHTGPSSADTTRAVAVGPRVTVRLRDAQWERSEASR